MGAREDKNVERNMDNERPRSEVNKDSSRNWARDHLCGTLAKNMALFCLGPENLSEDEFRDHGLICLAQKIPR